HPGRQVPVDTIRRHCRSGILRTRASTPTTTSGSGTAGAELSAGDDGLTGGGGRLAEGPLDDDGLDAEGAGARVAARHPRTATRAKTLTTPTPIAVFTAGLIP
ncbi:MAG: hypothetical protein Q7V58_02235, partial [Actinomycetota bacterium]|nr:hypothetical protein [Actinomycetota bacterium]